MTPLSNEILKKYQVRKSKKQKEAFIELLKEHFPTLTVQKGGFPKCRNIIIGDVESAKVVLTAHYDTCARLPVPNFIAPKNPILTILYSILLYLPLIVLMFLLNIGLEFLYVDFWTQWFITFGSIMAYCLLLLCGPANKHTANDNTSGVITLCELLTQLDDTQRNKVAFVFFDHEETGLIGSSYFRSKFKKQMKNKLLINLDCVSDGDHILVSANKAARKNYGDQIKNAFLPTDTKSILFSNAEKTYYPSDQLGFKQSVAIAALKRKKFIGYYMDRIHTAKDTVFDHQNIALICNSILNLLKGL